MAEPLTRILSDLHFGDERSRLRDLAALSPLLEGVDTLVLNGDCCHTQAGAVPAQVAALRAFFNHCQPRVVMVTGNHDPDISPRHELALEAGRVWVTHGDVLFDSIAPWCHLRAEILRRLVPIRRRHAPEDWLRVATRLGMIREACLGLPCEQLPVLHSRLQRLARLARDLFPPQRALAMLHTWAVAPGRAARLAAAQRPAAQVVVIGHVHYPGVWRRAGRTVINTGAFCPPLGALLVDLTSGRVLVRQVAGREGAFHPGRVVADFALAPPVRQATMPGT